MNGKSNPPRRLKGPSLRTVPAGVEYHRVLVSPSRRFPRGIFAITLLLVGMVAFAVSVSFVAAVIDQRLGRQNPTFGGTDNTPLYWAGNMIALALLVPWSAGIQRWLYGVPGASIHSVFSRFRFDLLGRAVILITPLWIIVILLSTSTSEAAPWTTADLLAMFAITIVLTPLQAAGEEYGLRGLVFRVAGSWSKSPVAGLIVGIIVSSVLFVALHLSNDPWRNIYYLAPAISFALITWRTGGLEIAVVLHALNNTLLFLFEIILHSEFRSLQERSSGGDVLALIPTAGLALITAVIWWKTRRTGPTLTPGHSPQRSVQAPVQAPAKAQNV